MAGLPGDHSHDHYVSPVFTLKGIDGKVYSPLVWTKTLTLASVAVLSVLVVPVLCHFFIRGRIRHENESRIVRNVASAYRPLLNYFLCDPTWVIVSLSLILIFGLVVAGFETGVQLMTAFLFSSVLFLRLSMLVER